MTLVIQNSEKVLCLYLSLYMFAKFGHVPIPQMVNKVGFVVAPKVSTIKVLYETVHVD